MNTKLLRQKILDLAIRGKLTTQLKTDGTTADLLKSIASECHPERSAKGAKSKDLAFPKTKSKDLTSRAITPLNKNEAPFEIPATWEWVKIDDIALDMADGPFGSNLKAEHYTDKKEARIIQLSNIAENGWRDENVRYTTFEHAKNNVFRSVVEPGNLVVAKMMPAGRTMICPSAEKMYVLSSDAVKLVPNDNLVNRQFLCYVMNSPSFRSQINDNIQGTTRLRTSISKLRDCLLPLPPLAEQHRIVQKIETAFAEIAEIEKNQELLKTHIKQGRQKILDLAIRGKLTTQLKTDGTTADLLKSIASECHPERSAKGAKSKDLAFPKTKSKDLTSRAITPLNKSEAPFEIPETWEWVRLGDVAYIASGSTPSKDCFVDEGIPYLKMYNLRNQEIDFAFKPQYIKRETHEGKLARSRAKPYDVLMNIVGPPLGKIAIIPESLPECNFNQAAVLIRPHFETKLMSKYIRFYLMQMGEINSINTKGTAGQENLSLTQTQNMRLPLPPLAEQHRIVQKIETAFTEFDAMEKEL